MRNKKQVILSQLSSVPLKGTHHWPGRANAFLTDQQCIHWCDSKQPAYFQLFHAFYYNKLM